MDSEGSQTPVRVDGARDDIGGENVRAVGVRISQEVGEGYGGERVVVGEG